MTIFLPDVTTVPYIRRENCNGACEDCDCHSIDRDPEAPEVEEEF